MVAPIRWGILGTGGIARGFAEDLRGIPDAQLLATGSRSAESADRFGAALGVPRRYGSYEALAGDPDVDIVYVATPHARHRDDCLLALGAGKPVLCEKPFTLNAAEAREVVERARARRLFCMEAMWTRFLPIVADARQRVLRGEIGALRTIFADFGAPTERRSDNRFFDPRLGGGALLDRGVYGVSLAHWYFGAPATVQAVASMGDTGVDEQDAVLLGWPDGRMAVITASLVARTHNTAMLVGTTGSILQHEPFYGPPGITVTRYPPPRRAGAGAGHRSNPALSAMKRAVRRAVQPVRRRGTYVRARTNGHGYRYEAIEAMRCLRAGATESAVMPLEESVQIMETMDRARAQWGLVYPQERA
ncbi:MAG: Gfo/Idh/MocA family protein [Dehalococcoidia bacterium]